MNADNAMSNNTQGETLADMPNSFQLENCVHCFNHTLQLSAKTLLCPFNAGLGKTTKVGDNGDVDDLLDQEDEDEDAKDEDDDDEGLPDVPDVDDVDDGIDELDALDAEAHKGIIANIAAVHETVSKLCSLAFAIV